MNEGYIGPLDLNVMIGEEGQVYGLEWTPRFGLDAMPTWLQMVDGEVGEIISGLVDGSLDKIELLIGYASGVRLSIPPYPIEPESLKIINKHLPNYGVPIRGFDGHEKSTYFYEVLECDGTLYHSAGTGAIAVVSDCAGSIEESFEKPYDILEKVMVPDKQYRTDLAKVIPEMHKKVEEVMYA
jgi:phosphoribosylamine--glycine ligase